METLLATEAAAVSGMTARFIRDLVDDGLVAPARAGGKGRGLGHRFTVTQVVGLAVAEQLRRQPRGCHPTGVGLVVAAFGRLTEAELLRSFERQGLYFVTLTSNEGARVVYRPVFGQRQWGEQVDVRAIYERVVAAAEAAGAELVKG